MTMGNEQRLRVIIEAVDRASQTIKSISGRLATELRQIGRRMLFIGGIVTGFAGLAVRAAESQMVAQQLLRQTVESLGGIYETVASQVETLLTEQDRLSKFNRTDLTNALNSATTALGNLDAAMRLLPAAVALASGAGLSLEQAIGLITKAILGDDGSIQALSRLGIEVEGTSGWLDILTAILKRYGQATEIANTPTERLKGAIHGLVIAIGTALAALIPVIDRITKIAEGIAAWAKEHPRLAQAIAVTVAALFALLLVLGIIATFIGAVAVIVSHAIIVGIIAAVLAMVAAGLWLWANWEKVWNAIKSITVTVANSILAAVEMMVNGIISGVNFAINALNRLPGINIPGIPSVTLPRIGAGGGLAPSAGGIGPMAGSTATIINNFNAPIYGMDDFRAVVTRVVRDAATGGGFNRVFEGR